MYKIEMKLTLILEHDETAFLGENIRQVLAPMESYKLETISERKIENPKQGAVSYQAL